MWVTKLLLSPVKITIFPKTDQIWPKIGIFVHFGPGLAGSFGALSLGWLVARGLYLARHLFTLFILSYLGTFANKSQQSITEYEIQ